MLAIGTVFLKTWELIISHKINLVKKEKKNQLISGFMVGSVIRWNGRGTPVLEVEGSPLHLLSDALVYPEESKYCTVLHSRFALMEYCIGVVLFLYWKRDYCCLLYDSATGKYRKKEKINKYKKKNTGSCWLCKITKSTYSSFIECC